MSQQAEPKRTTTGVLRREVSILNRLVEVSVVMTSTLQLDPLLEYIMEAAIEVCDAETASIMLVDKNTSELRFTAALGESGKSLIGMIVPMEGSIAGSIISEDKALIIDQVYEDPRHYTKVDQEIEFRTRSILGVPLRIRDQLVGVLEVLNKNSGPFTFEDMQYIEILASQAAVAIENARLLSSLEQAYADLSRIDKLKTDFISVASHELRTPLSVILGYATFLKEDAAPENQDDIDMLLASALKMRGLIEGMTNLRLVQLSDSEMNIERVVVIDLMRAAFHEILPLADTKEHIFVYEPDPAHADICVLADRAKVQIALGSVLHNAVKFTPPGGAIILSGEFKEAKGEYWIVVRDNGFGIPSEELERIFDQFYQIEDYMDRQHEGLGLGLAIARAIVERVGGRIWAESPGVGEGSRFTLALPICKDGAGSSPQR